MPLQEEIKERLQEASEEKAAAIERRRQEALKRVREGFAYIFGEEPESVTLEGEQAVAHMDGIRFVVQRSGSATELKVLCTCKACGEEYVSYEGLGSIRSYSHRQDEAERRRKYGIQKLVRLQQRDYQPTGYSYDHQCYEGSLLLVLAAARTAAKKRGISPMAVLQEVARLPEQ